MAGKNDISTEKKRAHHQKQPEFLMSNLDIGIRHQELFKNVDTGSKCSSKPNDPQNKPAGFFILKRYTLQ